jgi:hypothetical protein
LSTNLIDHESRQHIANEAAAILPERITRFPFPFPADSYRYSTNIEPALKPVTTEAGEWGTRLLDIDEHYLQELGERTAVLQRDPSRLQDLDLEFTAGVDASLPTEPLLFLGSQIQDDIALLDHRENALWLDAGLVTFAADWSLGFDVGMKFLEVHGPVPRVHDEQIITRAQQFLMRLQPGEKYRRTNWTMTVDRRLDTSTETYPEWAPDRSDVVTDPALPDRLHLRVEVQHLIRLPHSGAILFLVRTHLLSLSDIARVPAWRERLGRVLAELPPDMADYKGIGRYREAASAWLLAG